MGKTGGCSHWAVLLRKQPSWLFFFDPVRVSNFSHISRMHGALTCQFYDVLVELPPKFLAGDYTAEVSPADAKNDKDIVSVERNGTSWSFSRKVGSYTFSEAVDADRQRLEQDLQSKEVAAELLKKLRESKIKTPSAELCDILQHSGADAHVKTIAKQWLNLWKAEQTALAAYNAAASKRKEAEDEFLAQLGVNTSSTLFQ